MDIHKPKPVHSWREFLNEITIIIIGVLIALGLEQSVEQWHWHNEVSEAREILRKEITGNLTTYRQDLDNRSCVLANLDQLRKLVKAGNTSAVKAATGFSAWTGLGLNLQPTFTTGWETANSSGLLAHMNNEERRRLADAYGFFTVTRSFRFAHFANVGDLVAKGANYDGSPEQRSALLDKLSESEWFYHYHVEAYRGLFEFYDRALDLKPRKYVMTEQEARQYGCRRLQPNGQYL